MREELFRQLKDLINQVKIVDGLIIVMAALLFAFINYCLLTRKPRKDEEDGSGKDN